MGTVDFACKKIPLEQVIRCGFGLSKTEYALLKLLLNQEKELDINTISKKLGKDRTTAQRAMKKLVDSGLVFRRQMNIEAGGFQFYYRIKSKEDVKKKAYENFCSWRDLVESELKKW